MQRQSVFEFVLLILFACPTLAETIDGKVTAVQDGDTLTILDSNNMEHKIRLVGIDAPERRQPFGSKAKQALSDKVFGKTIRVEWNEKDRYGRMLGKVLLGERWINRDMIEDGFAWHYKTYSTDAELTKAEDKARTAKVGLWAEKKPIAPWEYRKGQAARRSSVKRNRAASAVEM